MWSIAGSSVVLNHNDRFRDGFLTIREYQFDHVTDNKLVTADWFAVFLDGNQCVDVLCAHAFQRLISIQLIVAEMGTLMVLISGFDDQPAKATDRAMIEAPTATSTTPLFAVVATVFSNETTFNRLLFNLLLMRLPELKFEVLRHAVVG